MAPALRARLASAFPFFAALKGYSGTRCLADAGAGVVSGLMALPIAMALGMASGVTPQQGITTGIVAGVLISFFGGARLCIGGPAAALVVIACGIVTTRGIGMLVACTMLAGLFLVLMGLFRLGRLFAYIPYSVTAGLTSGIAVLLLLGQAKEFFGLPGNALPLGFAETLHVLRGELVQVKPAACALAVGSLVFLRLWRRLRLAVLPGPFVVLVAGTVLASVFELPVATIGSQFGEISQTFSGIRLPAIEPRMLGEIFLPAMVIAILVAIESVPGTLITDGRTGDRHQPDRGLVGVGFANLVAPVLGGIPAAVSMTLTAANLRAGAVSPVSGIIHSATLLAMVVIALPFAGSVPLAVLSALIVSVAIRMFGWWEFFLLRRMPLADGFAFLTVFSLTIVCDVTVSVPVGMCLAAMLHLNAVTSATAVGQTGLADTDDATLLSVTKLPGNITVLRVGAPHLLGAADMLEGAMPEAEVRTCVVILSLEAITSVNGTALNALEVLISKITAQKGHVILSGVHTQPYFQLARGGLLSGHDARPVARDLAHAVSIAGELVRR